MQTHTFFENPILADCKSGWTIFSSCLSQKWQQSAFLIFFLHFSYNLQLHFLIYQSWSSFGAVAQSKSFPTSPSDWSCDPGLRRKPQVNTFSSDWLSQPVLLDRKNGDDKCEDTRCVVCCGFWWLWCPRQMWAGKVKTRTHAETFMELGQSRVPTQR